MSDPLLLTVDVERLLSAWLRDQPEIIAIVGTRVYTEPPQRARALFPFLRLQQIGGSPVHSRPLYLDESYLQFDCYGGPKVLARLLMDNTRALLATRVVGAHPEGVITGCEFRDARYLPDDEYDPAQPRWVFDVSVYSHP